MPKASRSRAGDLGRWALIAVAAGVAALAACGPPRSSNRSPENAAAGADTAVDGGHPNVAPTGKGVIVPSDTKIGANPTGQQTTGTSGGGSDREQAGGASPH